MKGLCQMGHHTPAHFLRKRRPPQGGGSYRGDITRRSSDALRPVWSVATVGTPAFFASVAGLLATPKQGRRLRYLIGFWPALGWAARSR